jgi:phosphatidylserine/phosphatidylglycerophosphate/cardiolipin synthase-like enzyme
VTALARVPNVEVRVLEIPPFSGGEIAFARVAHAKYAVFDDDLAWIGTSNWEGDYFLHSRNVSLFVRGEAALRIARLFADVWRSPHTRAPAAPP